MKVAIVTGGASGIGRALVVRLLSAACKVVVADKYPMQGAAFLQELKEKFKYSSTQVVFFPCDVCKDLPSLFRFTLKHFSRLDIMINNAGIGEPAFFDYDNDRLYEKVMAVNVLAVMEGTRLAVAQFREQKSPGLIISTGSMSAFSPVTLQPIYSASKAAVVAFTRACRRYKKEGIRVAAVCPYFVETPMTQGLDQIPALAQAAKQMVSMEEVVDAFLSLVEDREGVSDIIPVVPVGVRLEAPKRDTSKL